MTAEKFVQEWLDKMTLPILRSTYDGEKVRWRDGPPEGACSDEAAVSVEAIEFQLADDNSKDPGRALFSNLSDTERDRHVFEALKRLVDVGKAVRVRSSENSLADQLFKPANLLEAMASAAR